MVVTFLLQELAHFNNTWPMEGGRWGSDSSTSAVFQPVGLHGGMAGSRCSGGWAPFTSATLDLSKPGQHVLWEVLQDSSQFSLLAVRWIDLCRLKEAS